MQRMPILIACAATLAALGGAGIAMNKPSNSLGQAPVTTTRTEPVATATPEQPPLAQDPVPAAEPNQPSAQPQPVAGRNPAPTTAAPAPAPAPPLPEVIRRLAIQAQAEPAQPYQPQSVAIRDEIVRGSDFDRFRARLRLAVRDRDADFLHQVAHEHIKLSFGADMSLDQRLAEPNAALWQELERAIGGDCAPDGNAPNSDYWACPASFVADAVHPDIDPYMVVYVDGTDVAVRQLPSTNSPVLTRVSNSILQSATLPWNESLSEAEDVQLRNWYQAAETADGWQFVSLPDGRKGFVSSRYAYSSLGYRAIFQQDEAGSWIMTAFVAGD